MTTPAPTRGSAPSDRAVRVLEDLESASALADPERRRLVAALREEPDSATGLARRLGDSRQRLNYHLRSLEEAGVLELVEERRKGNCTERVLGVVARRFVVDPTALGELDVGPEEVGDRFSATYLIALAARAIRELASLTRKARLRRKRLATASLSSEVRLASPDAFRAFVDDLTEAVSAAVARHHDAGEAGRSFRVVVGTYPGLDEPEPSRESQEET